jgi:hypothetical protein
MTKRQAILASIEHWEQNLDMLILNNLAGEELTDDINTGSDYCSLCKKYKNNCVPCPIGKIKINDISYYGCSNTPYEKVSEWHGYYEYDYNKGYRAIKAEIKFLYSLLD